MRATIDRALGCRPRLSRFHLAVVMVAIREVGTYGRTADRVATRVIAARVDGQQLSLFADDEPKVTGWQRRRVAEALRDLAGARVLGYRSGRGRNSLAHIELYPSDEKGESNRRPLSVVGSSRKGGRSVAERGVDPSRKGVNPSRHTNTGSKTKSNATRYAPETDTHPTRDGMRFYPGSGWIEDR